MQVATPPDDHVTRMLAEANELLSKMVKLGKFAETETFRGLHQRDRELLLQQHAQMGAYLETLQERIDRALDEWSKA